MIHTNLYNKYKALDAIEREELKKAVLAHGGEIRFKDENGDAIEGLCTPMVMATGKHWAAYCECTISRITITCGSLKIYGHDSEYGVHEELLEVMVGQIGYIIDMIPETKEVQNVSEKLHNLDEVSVISLCREDIKTAGFSPEITDDQLKQVANQICKYLEWQGFFSQYLDDIREACRSCDISPLDNENDEK